MTKIKLSNILLGCLGVLLCTQGLAQQRMIGAGDIKNAFSSDSNMNIASFTIRMDSGGSPVICVRPIKNNIQPGQQYILDFSQCPPNSSLLPVIGSVKGSITDGTKSWTFYCPSQGSSVWTYQPNVSGKVVYTVYSKDGGIVCSDGFK